MLSKRSWRIEKSNFLNFKLIKEIINKIGTFVHKEIMNHLGMLSKSFDGYFSSGELKISGDWIISPFSYNLE